MGKKTPNLAAGQWDLAQMARLDNVLASDPDNVVANYEKGIILLELCRNEEAIVCFENALRRDPGHMKSLVGKGRALMMGEDYDGAKKCFDQVPKDDEEHEDAAHWSGINDYYRSRRGKRPTNTTETVEEKNFRDSLDAWMSLHLNDIQNLKALLNKFRSARDGNRRKDGNVLHAYLVKKFYEHGGAPKVVAVECNDIEPDTDVDIRLDGDIYIQVWYGKMPAEDTLEDNLMRGVSGPMPLDWCEELKPVLKKLKQLPSKTGKGFVVNVVPGIGGFVSPGLHDLCSERKCVMEINPNRLHINVYGKSCFGYRDEACQIARMLGKPLKFILGDWNEMQAQGRNLLGEAAYGFNVFESPYRELFHMDKDGLLNYAEQELKDPHHDDLVNLHRDYLLAHVLQELMFRDSGCQDDEPR